MIKTLIKKLDPQAKLPVYATLGAACFDLFANDDGQIHPEDSSAIIYGTGLAIIPPEGYALLICSRSGHGFKKAIRHSAGIGIGDPDYTGEIKVSLRWDSARRGLQEQFKKGDRIAQAMVIPCPRVKFEEIDTLPTTERGSGGFGSTGNN